MTAPSRASRILIRAAGAFLILVLLPLVVSTAIWGHDRKAWYEARTDPTGLAPDPAATPEAVVQIYAARAFGWRGAFGVHTWFAVKPAGAAAYTRLEVLGWAVRRGGPAVRIRQGGPDNYWFDSYPSLLLDLRGPRAAAAIPKILAAAESYPFDHQYRLWPGPNSNTFTAYVARRVPGLDVDLPPNAIGKDYLADGIFAPSPSGTGYQISLSGVAGLLVAREEGFEINLFGLVFGLDYNRPALKLPGLGRLGMGA